MSSNSVKESASVAERKHDFGNSYDLESSSDKYDEDINPTRADKVRHSYCQIGHPSGTGMGKLYNVKYFIIKSLNHQNIRLSIEKGIWATQTMNEPILEEAFHNSGSVILIFSVNMSGCFQGYAQMLSSIGWRRDNVWSDGSGKSKPWGRTFKVKWLCLNDLPFHKTLHLKNPLNEYKPVKISRDCQELSPDIGLALCELLDCNNDVDGLASSSRNNFSSEGHSANTPSAMGDQDCNFPSPQLSWSMPMAYSSIFSQNQAEVAGIKRSHFSGRTPTILMEKDVASQFDEWGLFSECPLASSLTDDDFLDMSYEEYLEIHSRCRKQLRSSSSATKRYQKQLESLGSNTHDDDRNLGETTRDWNNSHKRMHQSYLP
ncbi:uncharacterized protein [Cicer arietinum]|uniref:YTH domain-containing family protein n=1 Tax=Cicer arietinum TaxID=3827 RepID=A0A3Q7Y482_CICAR|nr:uncharacterized protein LOC101511608 isoform X2 [Cicer arietinum]